VVIYPNVDVENFQIGQQDGDFYVTASRIVPYKQIPLIINAFKQMPSRKLIVIGTGPLLKECIATAPSNVQVLGYQPDDVLHDHLMRARAFIFAAEEDFGIAPVEAQACGAAQAHVGRSFDLPHATALVTGIGALNMLEATRKLAPDARFLQASSAELFGNTSISPQNEDTPFKPRSPYGAAKLLAYSLAVNYFEGYGLFAANGIFFNYESPLRSTEFCHSQNHLGSCCFRCP
jgi:hypothetical protein